MSKLNNNEFLDANWPVRYQQLLHRICRIETFDPEDNSFKPKGTGFLIGPDWVMTNYHVLEDVIDGGVPPENIRFRFDFFDGATTGSEPSCQLAKQAWRVETSRPSPTDSITEPDRLTLPTLNQLDYAIVCLSSMPGHDDIGGKAREIARNRGCIPLPEQPPTIQVGDSLLMLQHPRGESLKVDLDEVIKINKNNTRILYTLNTDYGSSGSPCFNQKLELVALHHFTDPAQPPQYNQGIPIAAIVADLQRKGMYELVCKQTEEEDRQIVMSIPDYLQEEIRELEEDYEEKSRSIKLVRQQIREIDDLDRLDKLETKLERLKKERREIAQKLENLRNNPA